MDVFTALADPTRRRIVELLAAGPRDAGSIVASFAVSQPAVSRHLRVLRESGIVAAEPIGRRRRYRLHGAGLSDLETWVDRYRTFWADGLDRLTARAEEGSDDG